MEMIKGHKYLCKPKMVDCLTCKYNEEGSFCFKNYDCSVPFGIVQDEKVLEWLSEDKKYHISYDLGSEEGDKEAQVIIDMKTKEIVGEEEISKHDKIVDEIREALFAESLFYDKKAQYTGNEYFKEVSNKFKILAVKADSLRTKPSNFSIWHNCLSKLTTVWHDICSLKSKR